MAFERLCQRKQKPRTRGAWRTDNQGFARCACVSAGTVARNPALENSGVSSVTRNAQVDPALAINPECRRNEKANLAAAVLGAPADEDWGVMKAVILVHGGWHGGWCWRDVADQLRTVGHRVYTPTLTGLGEREHLFNAEVGIDTHVQDLLAVLKFERLDDVVLVGHSYGGVLITLLADLLPQHVRALLYIDAMIPEDGRCDWDAFPAARRDSMLAAAATLGGTRVPVPDFAVWRVTEPSHRDWLRQCCTPHPLRPIQEAPRVSGRWLTVARKHYVLAAHEPDPRFLALHRRLSADPTWVTHSIDGGHELMLSHPGTVADLIHQAAS
jgi:pimeloyl-ACP methyl ester carboxylesterase